MDWSVSELLSRLEVHDECQRIEAKATKNSLGNSLLETISAFANEPGLCGGYLVLGLRPRSSINDSPRYTLQGVDNPDRLQQELVGMCRNSFNVQISPEVIIHVAKEKVLIVAYIPEVIAREKPVYIKAKGPERGSFRRIGSADYRCTSDDLDFLYQLRSSNSYESEVLSDVSWEDIDQDAVTAYRRRRFQVDPEAAELELDDQKLLMSLRCLVRRNGTLVPNVAGLLLFGTKTALRRMLPADARVDYVTTEGPEWIGDPSARHYSTDYRESLITLLPRLHAQIMGDLPKLFALKTGELQRTDKPTIPRDVIREALSNALMHRDYRAGQPTLVIRYSNRLEFKNAGYSLKPFEELGHPGSKQRNLIIAAVFHELKYAESKGTGIGSMKEWMQKAGLTTPPIIETDRDRNEFDLVLLPHHLLDQQDLEWLLQFRGVNLSDAQRRALVLAREMGVITNQDYRQVNGTDTLAASRALGHLRDLGFLSMKGSGNGTYYVLPEQAVMTSTEKRSATPQTLPKGLTPYTNPLHKGLGGLPKGFPKPSSKLQKEIADLPKRCPKAKVKEILRQLCSLGPLQPSQLGNILDRDPQYLRINFLSKMLKEGELVYEYPDRPAHPQQAYKTT